ncbi:MAG: DUF1189 family protein [Planctomycetota bacterium]|jgi:hypothetical protein
MKRFSIIHVPLLSFFSKPLYRDVALNWKGVCFGYLLLLLAVCWIPRIVKEYMDFSDFVEKEAPSVVEQVPRITIADGQVSIDEPQPYYIKDPDSGQVLAVIDTTDTITSPEDVNAFCLLTRTSVVAKKGEFETRSWDLSQVQNFVLDGDRIMGWLRTLKKFLVVLIYPLALVGSYFYRIIQALIYAAVGLLFAYLCKVKLSYAALLRLAVAAVTPCIILNTVLSVADVHLPYGWLFYLAMALAYLLFAVTASRTTPAAPQQAPLRPSETDVGGWNM